MTIILPKQDTIPMVTSGGLNTVGLFDFPPTRWHATSSVRPVVPLAAPSANLSGRPVDDYGTARYGGSERENCGGRRRRPVRGRCGIYRHLPLRRYSPSAPSGRRFARTARSGSRYGCRRSTRRPARKDRRATAEVFRSRHEIPPLCPESTGDGCIRHTGAECGVYLRPSRGTLGCTLL